MGQVMATDQISRRELQRIVNGWLSARQHITSAHTLTGNANDGAYKEFLAKLEAASRELVTLLGIEHPEMYEALCELVTNGRSIVQQPSSIITTGGKIDGGGYRGA